MRSACADVPQCGLCPHRHRAARIQRRVQAPRRRVSARAVDLHLPLGMLDALGQAAHHAPLAFERVTFPCQSMNCGDALYRSTLDAELRMEESGISPWFWAIVAVALGYLTASPGVLQGFWDTYIYAPFVGVTQPQLKRDDIRMGAKLAEGGFGQVFLAEAKADVPGRVAKGEKLVVKRADEFGEAEVWMNERLSRAAPHTIATFLNAYAEGGPGEAGPLLLAWKFEGEDTLADAMKGRDFPLNVEEPLLGRKLKIKDPVARRAATIKVIVRQLLENLVAIHRTGIVHRDVKPQNVLLSGGRVKFIDLGAGADLRVGINYVPNEYLLDPRYAPPQQYVMSPLTPKAPAVPLAAFLSPVLWRLNQPDRFDMYSVGVILLQLAFPPLRSDTNLIAFNKKIEEFDWDLDAWRADVQRRSNKSFQEGFDVLDASDGAGWDLLTRLLEYDHYNRFSAPQALAHRWLDSGKSPLAPLRRVARGVSGAVDGVFRQVFDTNSLGNLRQGLTEAELSSALEEGAEQRPPPPDMRSNNTVAWWQSRVKDQQKSGGLIGKIFSPNSEGQRRKRAKGAGGLATQRAYAASGSGASGSESERYANGGAAQKPGTPRPRTGIPKEISESSEDEGPGMQPAVKRAASAGLFNMFDRLRR